MYFFINFSEVIFREVILNFERKKLRCQVESFSVVLSKKHSMNQEERFEEFSLRRLQTFKNRCLSLKTILNFAWVLGKVGNTVLNLSKGTWLVFFGKAHSLWLILGLWEKRTQTMRDIFSARWQKRHLRVHKNFRGTCACSDDLRIH